MAIRRNADSGVAEVLRECAAGAVSECLSHFRTREQGLFSLRYVRQDHAEKAKILKMVLSNCGIDAVSLYPTYRKPFDLIFQEAKQKNGAPGAIRTPDLVLRSFGSTNTKCLSSVTYGRRHVESCPFK
jgi:hypothetical protein